MIKVDTKALKYLSYLDEEHFFTWAQEIDCIVSIEGGVLHISQEKVDEENLRDLLAIFSRYQLPLRQLGRLLNSKNESWFKNKNAYWYEGVFGNG